MKESYIKKLYSARIGKDKPKTEKPETRDFAVIDLSPDEPDAMADIFVVDTLYREAAKWENRGYCGEGLTRFNDCAADYLSEQFGVLGLAAGEEVSVTSGTNAALKTLALAFINRGDCALITKPTVAVIGTAVKWLGGTVENLPLSAKNNYYPKYEDIPQKSLKKAKLLYLSYPNNPTGQLPTMEFFEETVRFAKLNNLIVLHDAAFSALTYSGGRRISFLSAPGAKKVGAELHSMSYAFNMAGWGAGFIAGNKNIVRAYREIAAKSMTAQFAPVIKAAGYALSQPEISIKTAEKYERRAKLLVDALSQLGIPAEKPQAGCFVFVKPPCGTACGQQFESPRDFCRFLLNLGIKARAFDEGVRFSLTFTALGDEEESRLTGEFYERLKGYRFMYDNGFSPIKEA